MPPNEPTAVREKLHEQSLRNRDSIRYHRHHPPPGPRTTSRRPLIDYVTNEWQTRNNHLADPALNPAEFADEDYTSFLSDLSDAPPPWLPLLLRLLRARLTRRARRCLVACLVFLVLVCVAWTLWVGPNLAEATALDRSLQSVRRSEQYFGGNGAVRLEGMRNVAGLEGRWVPGRGEAKGEGVGADNRLVIVGDVHGCREELEMLLRKVEFREGFDHLVLAGDMIFKGPDSGGVVDLARRLDASGVRGNHDDRVLLAYAALKRKGALADVESASEGGKAPGEKHRKLARELTQGQVEWLEGCPVILDVGDIEGIGHVVVVHAGLVPGVALERQDPYQAMNMRTIDLGSRVPSEGTEGTAWDKVWNHHQKHIHPASDRFFAVYGHNARRGLNVQDYSVGLDTGCVKGGMLTALVIYPGGKREVVSVDCNGPKE
ncbi:Metallo-dependent phosphatase [Eremomyces bilateralis CBS 781.70]|uniref:Metallo-dependent phosphatase n=1 Tax=Eremomyces bilateralis CBS 781.70 TaxID=1392243 RepID=A0A6G1FS85_9PEZI|nr:Metallo-dependent phosphatase [Eremomyces bilateralis CBS 781.70]KAF1808539.1 Metallo-dependent phosphatase [Eremomyces bilateralis CBS 781.70]